MTANPNDPIILTRPEQPALIDAIREVHEAAFGRPDEADLVGALRQTEDFKSKFSVMALYSGKVVGHALYYRVTLPDAPQINALGLAPIGVLPGYQGQFVGSALVYEGFELARKADVDLLVVLGDPAYYGRFGYRPAKDSGLSSKFDPAGQHFQIKVLNGPALAGIVSEVAYHPHFDTLD